MIEQTLSRPVAVRPHARVQAARDFHRSRACRLRTLIRDTDETRDRRTAAAQRAAWRDAASAL